jgi:hypothetical protein
MNERLNNSGYLPFSMDSLIESDISKHHKGTGKFFESKDCPNKIIRVESVSELLSKHKDKFQAGELIDNARLLYQELGENYGISAPVDFYIGDGVAYSVCERIDEARSEDKEAVDDQKEKASILYASVAKYFLDKLKSGDMYLWDINSSSQYVFGKPRGAEGEKVNHFYLIDTDIWLAHGRSGLCLSIYWLTRHMSAVEQKFKTEFAETRHLIREFVESLPGDLSGEEAKNIEAVKDFLVGLRNSYNPKSAIPDFE